MKLAEETLVLLNRFLNGELSPDEQVEFNDLVINSQDVRDYLSINSDIDAFLENDDWVLYKGDKSKLEDTTEIFRTNEISLFSNILKEVRQEYEKPKKQYKRMFSVAATVLVIIVTTLLFKTYSSVDTNTIYINNSSWKDLPSFTVKGNSVNQDLILMEKLFKEKKYSKCILKCRSILEQNSQPIPNVLIYKGISHLELDEFDKSIVAFEKLIASNTIDFHKGYWYQSLVYSKQLKKKSLIKTLRIISNHPEYYNHLVAKQTLQKLESL